MKTAMQVKEVKSEGLRHELEVVLPASDIERLQNEKLEQYAKNAKVPGFRPGKVPLTIMKKQYGRAVMGEVLESAVNDSTAKVLTDKGLRPALQPKIEVTEFDESRLMFCRNSRLRT
jgi:trigger factor